MIFPIAENQSSYKSQLQIYAQKKGKLLPSYQTIREGPGHASRFKSVVTVDGKAFESPEYFHTVKEAESAAAKLALMSLPQEASSSEQVPVSQAYYNSLFTNEPSMSLCIISRLWAYVLPILRG
jgi:hypothetical protein